MSVGRALVVPGLVDVDLAALVPCDEHRAFTADLVDPDAGATD